MEDAPAKLPPAIRHRQFLLMMGSRYPQGFGGSSPPLPTRIPVLDDGYFYYMENSELFSVQAFTEYVLFAIFGIEKQEA